MCIRFFTLLFCFLANNLCALRVGIIVPAQHAAMDTIVSNIQKVLRQKFKKDVCFEVQNASGDSMLQQQIIQRMSQQKIDYIMPIGTSTALMTLAHVHNTPVICVAADIHKGTIEHRQQCITIINDEISVKTVLSLLQEINPALKSVGILYGNAEKNEPDIKNARMFCAQNDLILHLRKADRMLDIPLFAQQLARSSRVILILKDHMVVSSTPVLLKALAENRGCLVTMDDGSVQTGAHFGLGVREKDIGKAGGHAVIDLHKRNNPKEIQFIRQIDLSLFINKDTFNEQVVFTLPQLTNKSEKDKIPTYFLKSSS